MLDGMALDTVDGQVSDRRLTWSSNLSGILGTGRNLAVNATNLVEGTHTITLSAINSDGQTASSSVQIQVLAEQPVLPPTLDVSPSRLDFSVNDCGSLATNSTLSVRNPTTGTLAWTASADQAWIHLDTTNGAAPSDVGVAVDPTGMTYGDHTGNIIVSAPEADNKVVTNQVVVHVTPPTVQIEATDPNAAEAGAKPAVLTVTRYGCLDVSLVVNYTISGTASNGVDYNLLSGFVTIPAGLSNAVVVVTPIDDLVHEDPETIILTLNPDPSYAIGSSGSALAAIADNDPCNFSVNPTTVLVGHGSGNGSVSVTVVSGCSWTANSNVGWITIGSGSAGNGAGTVGYSVADNIGNCSARTGTVTVAGQTITVIQAADTINYTISVMSSPANGGLAIGGGGQPCNADTTVTATPGACSRFVNWTEDGTVVSTTTNYTFTVTGNRALVANFTLVPYTVTTSATSGGIVSGSVTTNCGASVTVTATPAACYQFANWTENGTMVSTATNYTFTVTTNRTLLANFMLIPYTVTTSASPVAGGTTSGGGVADCGSNVTVIAISTAPYHFRNWTENGEVVSTNANYSFTATTNRNLIAQFNRTPFITAAPSVTNAVLVINNQTVVIAGKTNTFKVVAMDPDGDPLKYQWVFGDGITNDWSSSALTTHTYVSSNCGPYTASVTVSDGHLTASSNLAVMAACDFLAITKLQLGLNFAKPNADTISLTAKLGLPGFTNVSQLAGFSVIADVGDAQVPFTLNNKGRGVSVNGTCGLAYTKPTKKLGSYWTATISLSKGTWRNQWAKFGLDNTPHKSPGKTVTLPVVVLINNEAFAAEPTLHYIATLKTGTAK